jgi:hypothetical protein
MLERNNQHELSLLSKTEFDWLLGNKQLSKSFEYKIKSTIRKKIDSFINFELPLLIQNEILDKQLLQNIIDNPNNMLPILGKEKVAGSNPAQGFSLEHEFHCLMRKNECLRYCI